MLFAKFLVFCNVISFIVHDVNPNPFKTLRGIIKSFREKASRSQRPGRGEFEIETRFDGEFPLANDNVTIEAMHELWKSYYTCLEETAGYIGVHRSITPRALAIFPGHSINLDCRACLSPADLDAEEEENENQNQTSAKQGAAAKWLFSSWTLRKPEPVSLDERVLQNPLTGGLHIYGFRAEDSGNYLCERANHISASYFLEIITEEEPISKVWPKSAPQGRQAAETKSFLGKFEVTTSWAEWSVCSACGQVAKKFRPGFCLISLIGQEKDNDQLENEEESTEPKRNQTVIDEESTRKELKQMEREEEESIINDLNQTKIRKQENILSRWKRDEDYENEEKIPTELIIDSQEDQEAVTTLEKILNLFKYGVPCRSKLLPPKAKKWPAFALRPHEIMSSFCKIRCPGVVLFEVRDENGVIIEKANNSAGVYSALQGVPPLPPPIERLTQFEETSKMMIEIKCPGSLASDIPVVWQIRGHEVIPVVLARESKRRIIIDPAGIIRIKRPRVIDSGLYSCWQREKLVGVVRLSVHKKITLSFNHHVMLIGINLIIGTFLLVFYRAFKHRHDLDLNK